MAITSYSCHKGGRRDSFISDDNLKVNVVRRSLCDRKEINKDIFFDQIFFNNILTDESTFNVKNMVTKKKIGRKQRTRGAIRKFNIGRSQVHYWIDKGLRSKRLNSEMFFEDSRNDDEDWIFNMFYDYIEDYPEYEDMTYNEYLAHLKKAS